ncbi:hypothetical protein V0R50_00455 [Pseudomonas sp. 148P]|uniref:Polymerase nucleotidyl transferase domain-containing protein n=1 Tax=Pseudomonas ulcerans TaxID=3115852 RepID=A0ABU7HJG8_9PSED|nr:MULTISPECIES: hypothetical protein [unclassified Pseudomonas]MEE1921390.1 hypothetical protein [Pseudomonas sp. 147P]MEE1931673.1 hypothetical protein [Pseudomonas sp. 148P]
MFVFDASTIIRKVDFDFFVEREKAFLEKSKSELFERYDVLEKAPWSGGLDKYESFRDKYIKVVHEILSNVIGAYRRFLPEKCLIVEFGSFAKRTERILSDFDFTICYDAPKIEQYEVAEELIDYSLACIFGFSIDHVHGKFQHYPDMPEVHKYSEKDNHYRLVFEDGVIDYKCGPETLNENLMHIKNVRDYRTMLAGYEEKYVYGCNIDCLYSIEILENSTEHDFLGDLTALEQRYDICDGYIFDLSSYELKHEFQVSEIKKVLKSRGVVEFYIFIAALRKKIGFCTSYSMSISDFWLNEVVLEFFGEEFIGKLKSAFLKFIFYFNRIEYSLNKCGIPLSTRCYKVFSLNEMNELLAQDWGGATDISTVIDARNELASVVQEGLCLVQKRA